MQYGGQHAIRMEWQRHVTTNEVSHLSIKIEVCDRSVADTQTRIPKHFDRDAFCPMQAIFGGSRNITMW